MHARINVSQCCISIVKRPDSWRRIQINRVHGFQELGEIARGYTL